MTPAEAAALLRRLGDAIDRHRHVPIALAVELTAGGRDRVAEAWSVCDPHWLMQVLLIDVGHPLADCDGALWRQRFSCTPRVGFTARFHFGSCRDCCAAIRRTVPTLRLADVTALLAGRAA